MKNPSGISAAKLTPTYQTRVATNPNDKICAIQNYVGGSTVTQLKNAGVTHVWENTAIDGGLGTIGIGICQNLSSGIFGTQTPTETQVRNAAEATNLYPSMVITDEFAEGDFPQTNTTQTSLWFSDQINIKATREGKSVTQHGEYGSQALHYAQNWKRNFNGLREPMSDYMLSLLQPNISTRIDACLLKDYLTTNMKNIRGRTVGYYYSFEKFPLGDYISTIPVQSMYMYNESNQDCIAFTWSHMQSNGHMIDVPQRSARYKKPNTTYGDVTFPPVPLEVMKIFGFLFPLLLDGAYLWGDWGVKPNDDNEFNSSYAGIDAYFVGVDWYTAKIPALNQAGRDLVCCDYTANGSRFSYTETERRISRKGSAYYNNSYFNKTSSLYKGFCICIPATVPQFIYLNPYKSPLETEQVVVHYDGRSFNLGTIPGTILYVS